MFGIIKSIGRNIVTIVALVGALIVGGYAVGKFESIRQPLSSRTRWYVETSRTIINNLQGMGQLVTAQAEVVKTDVKISIKRGFLNHWRI